MPGVQTKHWPPPTPHPSEVKPLLHAPFKQHPLAQVAGPQVEEVQVPCTQFWPLEQTAHKAPPAPQDSALDPATHWP